ncbi:hypothetical protein LTR86_004810 [Recurvomyces mirabilis]|nr:hypothetical protein LTR86_004810 [Recurvomyces mirabilis]
MVDVVSIVVACISLVGAVLAAAFTAYSAYLSDERKRQQELKKFFGKYRDALLLATQDLQSRFCNITDYHVMDWYHRGGREKESLLLYTSFVVGQFLCWIFIIRKQAQFLQYETDKATRSKDLTTAMSKITYEFATDQYDSDGLPFMLWRGDQMSIGELMLAPGTGEPYPMGYNAFHQKWTEGGKIPAAPQKNAETGEMETHAELWSGQFRTWFRPIIDGIVMLGEAHASNNDLEHPQEWIPPRNQRLRRLQHRLVDLMDLLDPEGLRSEANWMKRCNRAVEYARKAGVESTKAIVGVIGQACAVTIANEDAFTTLTKDMAERRRE